MAYILIYLVYLCMNLQHDRKNRNVIVCHGCTQEIQRGLNDPYLHFRRHLKSKKHLEMSLILKRIDRRINELHIFDDVK